MEEEELEIEEELKEIKKCIKEADDSKFIEDLINGNHISL